MTNLIQRIKNENPVTSTLSNWDPLRTWDIFRPLMEMRSPWLGLEQRMDAFYPQFDVKENREGYMFKADLPGVNESDLEVTFQGNNLRISGKRESEKEEKTDTYFSRERSYGAFTRVFTLPEGVNVDKARAEMKNGVLNLFVPRTPEAPMKKIEVKTEKK